MKSVAHPDFTVEQIMAEYQRDEGATDEVIEALSEKRLRLAYETVHAAGWFCNWEGIAAVGQKEPLDLFIEAHRNIAALAGFLYDARFWEDDA